MPPILLWMLIAVTWFLANGLVSDIKRINLPLQPKALGSLAIVFIGVIAAAAAFGPLTIFPLMFPPAYAFVRSVLRRGPEETAIRRVGVVHVLLIAVAVALSVRIHDTRTDAEYIAQWPSTTTAHTLLARLGERGPASLPVYRQLLVLTDNDYVISEVAARVAAIGDPAIDAPLLEQAARRLPNSADAQAMIRKALDELRTRRGAV